MLLPILISPAKWSIELIAGIVNAVRAIFMLMTIVTLVFCREVV
jgi:hypothetical protein